MSRIRDVRANRDWEDTHPVSDGWERRIPDRGIEKPTVDAAVAAVPMSVAGLAVPGSKGSIPGAVTRSLSPKERLWLRKGRLEPCFLCVHFRTNAVTPEEKAELWKRLVEEHGWSERSVAMDLGNPDQFEFCSVYELLTHRNATCPTSFKRREEP